MANLSWISSNPDYINQMIRNTQVTLSNNYNDLDNIPIIKITSTTNNPQKIWGLKEGLYMIDGVVQVDNNTSYEVSNLLISMTARLENGKYILSAFIPYLRGLFEYILKTNSTEYEQHQKIVLMIKNDTLTLDNETIYTPIENYHPATKKYVDDKANEIVAELDRMGVNKENLESLNKENRIRDIKLQALLSETSDRNITIEENVRYFDMPLSIDNGIVTINEMIGDTLVNVCDQEESVAITKSYTVENENHIALQGEYDGKCRPVVHGNTLVNHNADWDGNLQTGIETSASGIENVQVEGIKGQEVSVVVEGNTVLNHALGKTSAVVSNVEDNLWDFNYIDTTGGNGGTITYSSGRIIFEQTRDYEYTNVFLDRKDIIKPNTYYTLIVDVFINTLPTDSGIILNSYSATTYPASDVFTIYGTSNDGREGSQNKIHGGDIGRFIYKLKSKSDFSVSQYALRTFIGNTSQEGELEFSIKLFEGDHTTNPKYVNSNNGNYVDLTVANDMSSVVEIEGRTMVNVCDQKESIAITKSYTVENSGNHIALQGEYDGSCRPVIQGNTMVNLAPISYNRVNANLSDEVTLNSLNGDPATLTGRIKEFTPIVDLRYGTLYTITFDVISITEGIMVHGYIAYDEGETQFSIINAGSVGKYSASFTLSQDADVTGFGLYINTDTIENIAVIKNVMLFEGDLTQTPELIPTEYVEGLKNSFEDGYIPENLMTTDVSETEGQTLRREFSKNIYKSATVIIPSEYVGKLRMSMCKDNLGWCNNYDITSRIQHFSCNADEYYNCVSIAKADITLNELANLDIIVLEGDWTHLTEEDFNHLGKYKVQYKVTGKNLINEKTLTTGTYGSDGTSENDWSNYAKTDFIQVRANTKYIMCSLTYNDVLINTTDMRVGCYDVNKKFIKSFFTTGGLFTTTENTRFVKVSQFVQTDSVDTGLIKNWQLEEGTTPTEYEPYKSYTKTFYLNSPLLEGDTIEDVNGVATHVKRYGKVVLDGSEYWDILGTNVPFGSYKLPLKPNGNMTSTEHGAFCDNFPLNTIVSNDINDTRKGVYVVGGGSYSNLRIRITDTDTQNSIKEYLQANPTTVVYQLASPIHEPISTESILCDSYVNGHLDFDSTVPIEKVEFKNLTDLHLKYLQPNTDYTIQFESDNIGIINWVAMGSNSIPLRNIDIIKGINRVEFTTEAGLTNNLLKFSGIGFNASNIVVTEAIDADFDYFEGLKSSYECEVTEDGKYKVDVKVTGKNLVPPSEKWENGQLVEDGALWTGDGYSTISISTKDYIFVRGGFSYIFSYPSKYEVAYHMYNLDHSYISDSKWLTPDSRVFTPIDDCYIKITARIAGSISPSNQNYLTPTNPEDVGNAFKIQLEEGTVATSYEPYFESTKTFYLNSPLLEGDKIVTKNGKVYHYHKMGKVVLDGSENWTLDRNKTTTDAYCTPSGNGKGASGTQYANILCDRLVSECGYNVYNADIEGIALNGRNEFNISINKSKINYGINKYLQANPTTVVYELASPYYELIDEYNNTILNIPKNVAHLTHTSVVPVNNTVFTNYKDELNVLEPNTQYRLMFDCDKANVPFTITLGGTNQTVTSKIGTHSLLITTPSTLVDKNLVIDGIGRCGIDNIRIFKGKVEYDYVKGLWSAYEEKLIGKNLMTYNINDFYVKDMIDFKMNSDIFEVTVKRDAGAMFTVNLNVLDIKPNTEYTVLLKLENDSDTSKQTIFIPVNLNNRLSSRRQEYLDFSSKSILAKSIRSVSKDGWDNYKKDFYIFFQRSEVHSEEITYRFKIYLLEGDWTDNPPTYEEVMANEGKYAVKVKLDNPNATIFGKGGRL